MSLLSTAILALTVSMSAAINSGIDTVDPNFNVQIRTTSYGGKLISALKVLPDGKMLASGGFNTYNGQSVGALIRLNANGSLDPSFNNNLLASYSYANHIVLQADGKILIAGAELKLDGQATWAPAVMRLNADGTVDSSFRYPFSIVPYQITVDASGKIILAGSFQVAEDGVDVGRNLIRLNSNGTHDNTFRYQSTQPISSFAAINNKLLVGTSVPVNGIGQYVLNLINEDGSVDEAFSRPNNRGFNNRQIIVQPDNKILVLTEAKLYRLNEDGTDDVSFQPTSLSGADKNIQLNSNGKITVMDRNSPGGAQFTRFLSNGASDSSFNSYTYSFSNTGSLASNFAVQSDGGVIIGEDNSFGGPPYNRNGFVRLVPNGLADNGFNAGGSGFLTIAPGSIRAIAVQSDDKIVIGGRFDSVGEILRSRIARLNADATVDNTFRINIGGTGNYFSQFNDIYSIKIQPDGKLILSGNFIYFVNSVQKSNLVRLNADGSIDSTFNLTVSIQDYYVTTRGGQNRFALQNDGKIVVGRSNNGLVSPITAIRINSNGVLDNTFNSTAYNSINSVYIMDVALQTDGKVLIGGKHTQTTGDQSVTKSFLARLNSDGTTDTTFQVPEEINKEFSSLKILENGQILAVKMGGKSILQRFNSNGSVDASFNSGDGPNGRINVIEVLPNSKIMVGGGFSTFNNQPRLNLAKLNADGSLDTTPYTANQEVLSLTLDNQDRLLVGGNFTTIAIGGSQSVSRAYAARLITSAETTRTRFDFDGDGKSDVSVFRPENGVWHLQQSQSGYAAPQFGLSTDKLVPADYDGDGKTDLAVFRENPSDPGKAKFYILNSSNNQLREEQLGSTGDIPVAGDWDGDGKTDVGVYRQGTQTNPQGYFYYRPSSQPNVNFIPYPWGIAGDKPVVDDYDGDGKADPAVFRPSTGGWFVQRSRDGFYAVQFGAAEDKPVAADYDGDGKADQAVFRPSNGIWYVWSSTTGFSATQFGISTDKPVPADYDGDGKTDMAVYRDGTWFILNSTRGFTAFGFGIATDNPITNSFVP